MPGYVGFAAVCGLLENAVCPQNGNMFIFLVDLMDKISEYHCELSQWGLSSDNPMHLLGREHPGGIGGSKLGHNCHSWGVRNPERRVELSWEKAFWDMMMGYDGMFFLAFAQRMHKTKRDFAVGCLWTDFSWFFLLGPFGSLLRVSMCLHYLAFPLYHSRQPVHYQSYVTNQCDKAFTILLEMVATKWYKMYLTIVNHIRSYPCKIGGLWPWVNRKLDFRSMFQPGGSVPWWKLQRCRSPAAFLMVSLNYDNVP